MSHKCNVARNKYTWTVVVFIYLSLLNLSNELIIQIQMKYYNLYDRVSYS